MKYLIINGPNLNLLGEREPGVYGNISFEDYLKKLRSVYDVEMDVFQSNIEGEIIDKLHDAHTKYTGIILNAGGYTHTSVAIGDAVAAIETAVVEVHISNVHDRESYRHISMMASNCVGVISGFGLESYRLALDYFINKIID